MPIWSQNIIVQGSRPTDEQEIESLDAFLADEDFGDSLRRGVAVRRVHRDFQNCGMVWSRKDLPPTLLASTAFPRKSFGAGDPFRRDPLIMVGLLCHCAQR